jgi:hypothetical protein
MRAPIRLPDRRVSCEQRPMAEMLCHEELPSRRLPSVGARSRPLRRIFGPPRACGYLTRDFTARGRELTLRSDIQRGSGR